MENLKYIVEEIGVRVRFSVGNVKFVEWLKEQLNVIKMDCQGNEMRDMEIYEQGFVSADEEGAMLYNIAVKVTSPYILSQKALLISTHFDTALYSPGASDNGVNCMIILELLRNIMFDRSKFYYPIVFVWVNDEENEYYGAEAFTEHFLYSDVERFINLESTGGRGMSLMYLLGPFSIQKEISSIPKIHINSFGIEVASLEIFGGTDYIVYSREKKGMDNAFFRFGFYYHTIYDDINNVDEGCIQYLGDGVNKIIQKYCYNEVSALVETTVDEKSKSIFYDYLRMFQVRYSQNANVIFSVLFGLWSLIFPFWGMIIKLFINKDIKEKRQCMGIIVSEVLLNLVYFFGYLFSVVFGVVSAVLFGLLSSIKNVYTINTQYGFSILTFTLSSIIGILIPQSVVSFIVFYCFSNNVMKFTNLRYQTMNIFIGIFVVVLSVLPIKLYVFFFVSLNFNLFLTVVYLCETLILILLRCKGERIPDCYKWSLKESYLFTKIFRKVGNENELQDMKNEIEVCVNEEKSPNLEKDKKKEEEMSEYVDDLKDENEIGTLCDEEKPKISPNLEEDKKKEMSEYVDASEKLKDSKNLKDDKKNEIGTLCEEKSKISPNLKEDKKCEMGVEKDVKSEPLDINIDEVKLNSVNDNTDEKRYKGKFVSSCLYFLLSKKLIFVVFPLIIIFPLLNDVDFSLNILIPAFSPVFLRYDTFYISPGIIVGMLCGLLGITICFPFLPNLHIARNFCKIIFALSIISVIFVLIIAFGKPYNVDAPRLLELYSKEITLIDYNYTKNEFVEINGEYEFEVFSLDVYGINENDNFFDFEFDDGTSPRNIECQNDSCKFKMDHSSSFPTEKDLVFKQVGNNTFMFHFCFNETMYSKISFFGEKEVDFILLNITEDYIEHKGLYNNTWYTNNYVIGNTSSLIQEWNGFVNFMNYSNSSLKDPLIRIENHYCNYQTSFPSVKNMMEKRREFALYREMGGSCVHTPYFTQVLRIF